jgi:hypothetical protein
VITKSGLDSTWTDVERVRIIAIEEPAPTNAASSDTNITSFRRTKKESFSKVVVQRGGKEYHSLQALAPGPLFGFGARRRVSVSGFMFKVSSSGDDLGS